MKRTKIDFRLMVITDRRLAGSDMELLLKKAFKSGVRCIQIREKNLPAGELLSLSKRIKKTALRTRTKVIINERLDIAILSGADGVHSSSTGIEAADVMRRDKKLLKGRSVHSIRDAQLSELSGFDYLLFGPVFRTPAKVKYGAPQGLKKLKSICRAVKIPVFAVGGITPARALKCLEAGAYGVAAIRPFKNRENISKSIESFKITLGSL